MLINGKDVSRETLERKPVGIINVHFLGVGGIDDGKGRFFVVDSSRNEKSVLK